MPKFTGSCRFVWNKALDLQKTRLEAKEGILRYNSLAMLLPVWKKKHSFLADMPSQALQQVLKNLDQALFEAFDPKNPKKFPNFKKKYVSRDSLRYPQGFKIEGSRIFLPKLGGSVTSTVDQSKVRLKTSPSHVRASIGMSAFKQNERLQNRYIRQRLW